MLCTALTETVQAQTRQEAAVDTGASTHLTEAEFERDPAAIAGRALLEERLDRLTPDQLSAFWEAVGRCFGAPPPDAS